MKKFWITLSMITVITCQVSIAQKSVEVYGFAGYSFVDEEQWAGTGFDIREFDKFSSGYYLQVFPYANEVVSLGLEYGYAYLFYYTFFNEFTTVERNVDATRLLAVARLFPDRAFIIEGGLGYYFFDGFSDFTIAVAAGYRFQVSDRFSIPVKFRNDLIFDSSANIFQSGIDVGVSYGF